MDMDQLTAECPTKATMDERQDQERLQDVSIDVVGNAVPLIVSGKTPGRSFQAVNGGRAYEESADRRLRNYLKRLDA
jgi:hypothetical protein